MGRIFLSPPHMGPRERELLLGAFDSNWIAPLGPNVDAFEAELSRRLAGQHVAALASGTSALHLALCVLGVGPGDEVIVPTLTFAASANPVTYLGARPAFVDVSASTWTMDPVLLAEELEKRSRKGKLPKAVMTVDLYGQCADYDPIRAACAKHGVPLVEDAAEGLGATYRGRPAGTLGDLGAISFNGNKIITTSGGGALISANERWIAQARFLATQARDPAPHYQHSYVGYNYRLSNLLAAVGRGQLEVLDDRVAKRRENFAHYREHLGQLPGVEFMPEADYGTATRWLTALTIDPDRFGCTREDVRRHLDALDIEARPVWKPMHLQPVFSGCAMRGGEVAERLFRDGLCLPSGSSLTEGDRDRVVEAVRSLARPAH